jgi:uncharacterized protein (DUF433 family)
MAHQTIDLSKYIETQLFQDRPHIRGRRIPVATIAYNARTNGWGVSELADNFGLSDEQVLAALLYYSDHASEVDAQEAAYQAELDSAYEQHGDH